MDGKTVLKHLGPKKSYLRMHWYWCWKVEMVDEIKVQVKAAQVLNQNF